MKPRRVAPFALAAQCALWLGCGGQSGEVAGPVNVDLGEVRATPLAAPVKQSCAPPGVFAGEAPYARTPPATLAFDGVVGRVLYQSSELGPSERPLETWELLRLDPAADPVRAVDPKQAQPRLRLVPFGDRVGFFGLAVVEVGNDAYSGCVLGGWVGEIPGPGWRTTITQVVWEKARVAGEIHLVVNAQSEDAAVGAENPPVRTTVVLEGRPEELWVVSLSESTLGDAPFVTPTSKEVNRVLRGLAGELNACVEPARGTIAFTLHISPSGVASAVFEQGPEGGSITDPGARPCVSSVFDDKKFPTSEKGGRFWRELRFPFTGK
jgi:hypothetical protein